MLMLIFGSNFILIKKGLEAFNPLQVSTIRLGLAGLFMLPISVRHLTRVTRDQILPIAVVTILGLGLPAYLFALAQTQVYSSVASVINALPPLWVAILGAIFFKHKLSTRTAIGLTLGLLGVSLLVAVSQDFQLTSNNSKSIFIITAGFGYALSMLVTQQYLRKTASVTVIAIGYLMLLPVTISGCFFSGAFDKVIHQESGYPELGCIALLALAGNFFGNIQFYKLIQLRGARYASGLYFLIPIVATMWGVLDGEFLSWNQLAGTSIIFFGVYLVTYQAKVS